MKDGRNWDDTSTSKKAAQEALQRAKELEQSKRTKGAKYCRDDRKTYRLIQNK